MKRLIYIIPLLLTAMFFYACQEDFPELGVKPSAESLDFQITQNPDDPNMVILESLTPDVIPVWSHPIGRSTKAKDTVLIAFPGVYNFVYSVESAAGFVSADTFELEITTTNLSYVDDPLWTMLTGGVGNEKTWILDNGKYGLATGPLSYADPSKEQVWGNFTPNWEPGPGDIGLGEEYEAAEMTFKLKDGPYLETYKPNETTGDESGTYFLDADNHTLSTSDATIIRPASFIPNADNWTNNLRVLELTKNQLRIAIYRTNDEGPWWYILNYVSKEYADSYVPEAQPDPNFDFGDQMQILAGNSATTWKLSTETPFNWTDLNGAFLNDWNSISDYPDWTGFNEAAIEGMDDVRLTFFKTGDVILTQDDGSEETGTFTIENAKNLVTFEGLKPSIYISGGWVYATTTDYFEDEGGNVITGDNQWKIVKRKTISGVTTEVWFGKRDTGKKEYMVYHFVLESGIPNVTNEIIKGLCGKSTGTSSRTFEIDTNWPVDWVNLEGVGWTVAGTQDDWYWNGDIAASVESQTLTFSQTDGEVTVTKKDAEGNITSSPVEIVGETRSIIIPDINIIQFGAGSWLPTAGPEYKWAKGEFNKVEDEGMWIGVQTGDNEITAYHYVIK